MPYTLPAFFLETYMPHLLDLFCGNGGWSKAALRQGWTCTGIDITQHRYPGTLILSSLPWDLPRLLALHPSLIVASPPCDAYARHHLPWLNGPPPDTALLEWCVRLTHESPIPTIVECSRFSALHVPGSTRCGSYQLWGSLPALLPDPPRRKMKTSGTDPARRAEIEPILADWIIGHYSEIFSQT